MAKLRTGQMPYGTLIVDENVNLGRFTGGTVAGVTVKNDYDTAELVGQILADGCVLKRIAVWEGPDGPVVIGGNRRTLSVRYIQDTPDQVLIDRYGVTADVIAAVRKTTEKIEVEFIQAATLQEAMAFVNDQDTKPFSESGVIRLMFDAFKRGATPRAVGRRFFRQIATYRPDGRTKIAEAEATESPSAKEEIIDKWLTGYVTQEVAYAYECGQRTQAAFLAKALYRDQLTTEKLWERPDQFPMSRGNLAKLKKARDADKCVDGESFNATWNTLVNEYHNKETKPKTEKPKRPTIEDVSKLANQTADSDVREVLKWASDGTGEDAAGRAIDRIQSDREELKQLRALIGRLRKCETMDEVKIELSEIM